MTTTATSRPKSRRALKRTIAPSAADRLACTVFVLEKTGACENLEYTARFVADSPEVAKNYCAGFNEAAWWDEQRAFCLLDLADELARFDAEQESDPQLAKDADAA
jgi:hypothetical protein